MQPIETEKYKGYTVKIYPDETNQSPDDGCDENLFLVHYRSDFWVERKKVIT
jgi:hypothetical protein